ncbi:MAG: hypothetical protein D6732_06755, partial [Methanobacteriota archaeon]
GAGEDTPAPRPVVIGGDERARRERWTRCHDVQVFAGLEVVEEGIGPHPRPISRGERGVNLGGQDAGEGGEQEGGEEEGEEQAVGFLGARQHGALLCGNFYTKNTEVAVFVFLAALAGRTITHDDGVVRVRFHHAAALHPGA